MKAKIKKQKAKIRDEIRWVNQMSSDEKRLIDERKLIIKGWQKIESEDYQKIENNRSWNPAKFWNSEPIS